MTVKMIDTKWSRLTVLFRSSVKSSDKLIHYVCRCECGEYVVVKGSRLRNGETKSCGCLSKELTSERSKINNTKHGRYKSLEYKSYHAMKQRCLNKNNFKYPLYGGRGITVCERWLESFDNFYKDMGDRPEGTTLDRKDSSGNYEPSNCRWATHKEQNNNRRNVNVQ